MIEVGLEAAAAVRVALDSLDDWGLSGTRPGQYRSDLAADDAAIGILTAAGFGVVSEESGEHNVDREVIAVLDPVDGSTNASKGVPWFATSICFLDRDGPCGGVVVNQASGTVFQGTRGGGARCDGRPITPGGASTIANSIVGLSGWPRSHLGWEQFRALGAAALDICAVACGVLDAYIDCSDNGHAPWDYLAALLICQEAGARVEDAFGRDLVTRAHDARRAPVAAATGVLLAECLDARRRLDGAAT